MKKFYFISLLTFCLSIQPLFSQQWYSIPNPNGWQQPVGVNGTEVDVLKVINNELYLGGGFAFDSSQVSSCIQKFNANTITWYPLACGTYGVVHAIEEYNGYIYAGGQFITAKSCNPWPNDYIPNTNKLTKWNGVEWSSADSAFSNNIGGDFIYTLKYKNDLYIGGLYGWFPVSNGTAKCIVKYNGNTMDNMQGGVDGFPLSVRCMVVYKGDLYVAGEFLQAGGVMGYNNIARWDGANWQTLGTGVNGAVNAMAVDTVNNLLYVGGGFTQAGAVSTLYYAIWDGTNWFPLTAPSPNLAPAERAMTFFDGKLFVGAYSVVGSPMDTTLFYWNGSDWHWVPGPNEGVAALEVYNGNLYVGGYFSKVDTTTVNYIACYGNSCPGTPITLTLPYTGVYESQKENLKFKVYPNPAKQEINIEVTEPKNKEYMVRIYNPAGIKIMEQQFFRQTKIFTTGFSKGVYLVQVCEKDGKICHTKKEVIE